jgi:hypothetical protein
MVKAVSFMFELFVTISYTTTTTTKISTRPLNYRTYIEIFLIVNHLLDIFAHQFLSLFDHVLSLVDFVSPAFLGAATLRTIKKEGVHKVLDTLLALIKILKALDIAVASKVCL